MGKSKTKSGMLKRTYTMDTKSLEALSLLQHLHFGDSASGIVRRALRRVAAEAEAIANDKRQVQLTDIDGVRPPITLGLG